MKQNQTVISIFFNNKNVFLSGLKKNNKFKLFICNSQLYEVRFSLLFFFMIQFKIKVKQVKLVLFPCQIVFDF